MRRVTPQQLVVYLAATLAVIVVGVRYMRSSDEHHPKAVSKTGAVAVRHTGASGKLLVHVTGAVKHPGVYRLDANQRVESAVKRAGGAKSTADLQGINLAAKLTDGQQVVVPQRVVSAVNASEGTGTGSSAATKISINTATPEQLDQLDGFGPKMIEKILEYRKQHGGFSSIDQLDQIPGIGEKRIAALREQLTL